MPHTGAVTVYNRTISGHEKHLNFYDFVWNYVILLLTHCVIEVTVAAIRFICKFRPIPKDLDPDPHSPNGSKGAKSMRIRMHNTGSRSGERNPVLCRVLERNPVPSMRVEPCS